MDREFDRAETRTPAAPRRMRKAGAWLGTVLTALQLGLCAPAVAVCACPQAFLPVTLALAGAAILAAALGYVLRGKPSGRFPLWLRAGVYALFALAFVWIFGTAGGAFIAFGLAALCVFALDAANERIDLFSHRGPALPFVSGLVTAALLALALAGVHKAL